ncbi:MMPL family transporter [Dinoroseobacter sp. S124A]|uniref:MMPL family transporter n=1 Tax=Dinoroseobacter sp. S124A TaxID=3415128 RepID=UPI003C7ED94F
MAAAGAVAVGLVVDFTVHCPSKYLRAPRGKGRTVAVGIPDAFDTAETAILSTATILSGGFAMLVTSSVQFNADLGLLSAMAIVMVMLVSFLLLPSLLVLGNRKAPTSTASLKGAS